MSTPWTKERTEKFRATMAAKKADRQASNGEDNDPSTAALTKLVRETKAKKRRKKKVQSIPLDAIPDAPKKPPRKPSYAKGHPNVITKEWAAMEIVRLTMWLAGQK
jgi:hypothetical protein